jgi:hypothetical protein
MQYGQITTKQWPTFKIGVKRNSPKLSDHAIFRLFAISLRGPSEVFVNTTLRKFSVPAKHTQRNRKAE